MLQTRTQFCPRQFELAIVFHNPLQCRDIQLADITDISSITQGAGAEQRVGGSITILGFKVDFQFKPDRTNPNGYMRNEFRYIVYAVRVVPQDITTVSAGVPALPMNQVFPGLYHSYDQFDVGADNRKLPGSIHT